MIFATSGSSFALDSRQKAQTLRDQINACLVWFAPKNLEFFVSFLD